MKFGLSEIKTALTGAAPVPPDLLKWYMSVGVDLIECYGLTETCGFCTATCPTYQLLGDELDGPRGRIYLMKQVLEGETPTRKTQQHLDRCLTCRNCESTCPSGVQYGHLVDIGRKLVDAKVERPMGERMLRWALKEGLPSPLFAPAMKLDRKSTRLNSSHRT